VTPDPFAHLDAEQRARLRAEPHPAWRGPMLAVLTDRRFSDPDWIFERKLDGERALAFREGDRIRLLTRNRRPLERTYPELVDALAAQPVEDFVVDGEIVAFEGDATSFARLQGRMQLRDPDEARASGISVLYYLFDLLHLMGRDTRPLPLRARKELLRRAIAFADPLRFTPHRNEAGERLLDDACRKGWEGLIAKRASAPYQAKRSSDWLKMKCARGQELVIGGFTAPKGSRIGFGALLLGYYEDGDLRYAGRVGTGFDEATLKRLARQLRGLSRERSPFADLERDSEATWVAPRLVAEIGFAEWTGDGKLRHPRFLGLRRDKDPRAVRRERPGS